MVPRVIYNNTHGTQKTISLIYEEDEAHEGHQRDFYDFVFAAVYDWNIADMAYNMKQSFNNSTQAIVSMKDSGLKGDITRITIFLKTMFPFFYSSLCIT